MSAPKLYLTTYCFDASQNTFTYVSLSDKQANTNQGNAVWSHLLHIIEKNIADNLGQVELYKGRVALEMTQPQIILLLLESKELANPAFFDALAKGGGVGLRPYVSPSKRYIKRDDDTIYHPIVTLAYPDITYLHSEEKESPAQREWNKLIYTCIELDKRFKVLDCSIWHRYVPIDPFEGTFTDIFEEVLKDVVSYHNQGLYFTNASVISLEFQMRMLLHSYVAKFGDKGHSEVVTPFKFHSERQMARSTRQELLFLRNNWQGAGKLSEVLKWRLLIVDDQAGIPMSFIHSKWEGQFPYLKKSDLIVRPFYQINNSISNLEIDYKQYEPNKDIIRDALIKISSKTYDIIFLDYLLGEDSETRDREYGFEFLLKLLEDNRSASPVYKRDFLGKYWIFPISSYPHALSDKLIQLGISHLHEIWYMSQGADPVTSPYLYEYNILRFIKQKITRYFLSPSAFKVTINQLPFNTEHLDDYLWLKSLDLVLNNSRTRFELINQAHTNDNSSLFVGSLKEFINNQYNNIIDPIFRDITSIILFTPEKKKWSLTHYNEFNDLLGRFKKEYFEDYQDALQPFINRIEAIVNQNYNAQNNIKRAIEEKANFLSLAGMELWALPELLKDAKHIEVLELRDNNLSGLPDFITELSNLRNIDLSLNNFTAFPSVLLEFKHLARLDLSGNDMLKWDFYIADSKEKILEMSRQDLMVKNRYIESILNEVNQHLSIKDANKAIYVLKQIYGDIQQLGYENELVGLESRFNVYEKDYLVKGTVASAVWIEEHHSIIRGVELLVSNLRKDLFSNP